MSMNAAYLTGAKINLHYACEQLLLARHAEAEVRQFHLEAAIKLLKAGADDLGYTLTPIVTPSPDSGRTKEIGDVFQNHGA